jgi:phosphatidylglycerophosphate synthase
MPGPRDIYLATRKKHDQLWNVFVARPLASVLVWAIAPTRATPNQLTLVSLAIFVAGTALLAELPGASGAIVAVAVLELSYLFDCADGMLARHKKLASREGHLFDFFTDETKALTLTAGLAVRLYRVGGLGFDLTTWPAKSPGFLLAGLGAVLVVASGLSLTNFVRRPELTGKEGAVEAHYETVAHQQPKSLVGRVAALSMTFLRWLNHYPSHVWLFAILGRLDVFFWMYLALNALYLAKGWLGLVLRFGRFPKPDA